MKFFEIAEDEILNIPEIDGQHIAFIDKVNSLYNLLATNNNEEIIRLLDELTTLSALHFKTEEDAMKKHSFEHFFSHKLEHDRFQGKLIAYSTKVKEGKERLHLLFLQSLKRWFSNHIVLNDKKMSIYLLHKMND